MRGFDNSKIHISSNFILSISLLIICGRTDSLIAWYNLNGTELFCGNCNVVRNIKTYSNGRCTAVRYRPGVAKRVPGALGSQISMTFSTWRWCSCQPHTPATFNPRKCSWHSFSLGIESTTGPWYSRKEYVTEKSSDNSGNRSRDRPTSRAAP
jgi:hypothetical protein